MASTVHPLDPLSAAEIARAWDIVRTERALGPRVRVIFIMLHEPDKKIVLEHRPGDAVERAAFVVLVDSGPGKTYEAVVSLSGEPRAVVGARARRPARHRARRVRGLRGRGPGRPALAGSHAPARDHRSEPRHGGQLVGGQLRLPAGRGAAPGARAHVGAPPRAGQRLRAAGGQPADGRGSERDGGGRGGGRRASSRCRPRTATTRRRRRARAPGSSRSRSASPRARASSSRATSCAGSAGGCGSASRPARASCSTR